MFLETHIYKEILPTAIFHQITLVSCTGKMVVQMHKLVQLSKYSRTARFLVIKT